ncbi:hypothetical protein [aff. Roholtiella sp. LEGE 12411]|uniref:hypothetical protein n=1 Tax=aff. Roholtiella sp. LEGE 12411 TaxID=1828822 RepID=UPI00188248D3|nr:hypothetical protein [aff. Roholtiella sp. LEGE 12411]MBE9037068.1 hypothetical protein [aff. Roholtiella sp. LEGE 12411]
MTTPISSNPETVETKRQNFNITLEQEAKLNWLRDAIAAPNTKEIILRSLKLSKKITQVCKPFLNKHLTRTSSII